MKDYKVNFVVLYGYWYVPPFSTHPMAALGFDPLHPNEPFSTLSKFSFNDENLQLLHVFYLYLKFVKIIFFFALKYFSKKKYNRIFS